MVPSPSAAGAKVARDCTPGPGLNLAGCNYANVDLFGVNFSGSDLRRADLSGTDLNETNFTNADLRHANLSGAGIAFDCRSVSDFCPGSGGTFGFTWAVSPNFTNADLHSANLSSARLGGGTTLVGEICVPHFPCAPIIDVYPDSLLTGVRSGGITGTPVSLPSGWEFVDGYLAPRPPILDITTSSVPGGIHGVPYSAPLGASGGTPPYRWTVVSGSLSVGLHLQSTSGVISGTAKSPGLSAFTLQVADTKTKHPRTQRMATHLFTLQVT